MARIASTLISVVLLLAGCASTQRLMLGPARAPIDPSEVRIYHAAPPGSVDVAQLEAASGVGFGTPGQERAVIDRLRAVTAAQVQSVAQRYFSDEQLTTAVLVPDPSRRTAAGSTPSAPRPVLGRH